MRFFEYTFNRMYGKASGQMYRPRMGMIFIYFGVEANYVDDRYTALDNQVVMPAYTTVDAVKSNVTVSQTRHLATIRRL
jgi:hypothetical protein